MKASNRIYRERIAARLRPYGLDSVLNINNVRVRTEQPKDPNIQVGGIIPHNGYDLANQRLFGNKAWPFIGKPQVSYEGTSKAEFPDPTSRIHSIAMVHPTEVEIRYFTMLGSKLKQDSIRYQMATDYHKLSALVYDTPIIIDTHVSREGAVPQNGFAILILNDMLGKLKNDQMLDVAWFVEKFAFYGIQYTHHTTGGRLDVILERNLVMGMIIFGNVAVPNIWAGQPSSLVNGAAELYLALCVRPHEQKAKDGTGMVVHRHMRHCILPFSSIALFPTPEDLENLGTVLYTMKIGSTRLGESAVARPQSMIFDCLLMSGGMSTQTAKQAIKFIGQLPKIEISVAHDRKWVKYIPPEE